MSKTNHKKSSKKKRGMAKNVVRVMSGSGSRGSRELFAELDSQYKFNVDLLDSIFDAAIGY